MKRLPFIPQLDSFRFIAVLLVMVSHWIPKYAYLQSGELGVTFFFVLSGYLISSNLLYLKQSIDNNKISLPDAFKYFYIRRTLRIFPLYYFAIVLLFLLIPALFEGKVIWYITYLPNILMFRQGYWPGMLSHFWSLGVEEQFYLLWPLLIFLVKWERLKYLLPATIVVSLTFKGIIFFIHRSSFDLLLPWSNFDAFGMGAILAYLPFTKQLRVFEKIPFIWGFLFCSALVLGVSLAPIGFIFAGLFISGSSFFIILKAEKGFTGIAGKILNLPALQYLGKISYGLYVYHNFIPWLLRCLTGKKTQYALPIALPFAKSCTIGPTLTLVIQFLMLVIVASLSWYLLEKPMNDLKNKVRPDKLPAPSVR